jgi:5,10-methylenetetrahydromethanopterin reductase
MVREQASRFSVRASRVNVGFAHIPKFGFSETVALIRSAESWGYDTAWLPDQPFFEDPYPLLAGAAVATKRIRLGVGVTNPFAMHPVLTARLAATVADASNGRFALGIGTGNRREYLQPLGLDGAGGAEACREAIVVIRQLLRGDVVTHRSERLVVDGARLSFQAQPDLPIHLAGIGPKVLEVAGEVADGAIVNFASREALVASIGHIERGRSRSTDRGAAEIVAWAVAIVTDDHAGLAYDRVRPFIAHTIAPTAPAALRAAGLNDVEIASIRETYWADGPQAAATHVTDAMVDSWCWIGSPEQLAERIVPLREVGIDEIAIVPFASDLAELRAMLHNFSEHVMPLLR